MYLLLDAVDVDPSQEREVVGQLRRAHQEEGHVLVLVFSVFFPKHLRRVCLLDEKKTEKKYMIKRLKNTFLIFFLCVW